MRLNYYIWFKFTNTMYFTKDKWENQRFWDIINKVNLCTHYKKLKKNLKDWKEELENHTSLNPTLTHANTNIILAKDWELCSIVD